MPETYSIYIIKWFKYKMVQKTTINLRNVYTFRD